MSDKTWRMRALVAIAGVGATAVVLAGCTSPGGTDGGETAPDVVDTQIILAETNEVSGFNPSTAHSNLDVNTKMWYATHETFNYINDQMEIVPNEAFGTMEKVSDDPLTIQYTIADGVQWSDGTPITTDDLLLGWAIGSGYYNDATFDEEGAVVSGTQFFETAGSTSGLADTEFPEVSEDKKSLTLTYDIPFVDWELKTLFGSDHGSVPVHVIGREGRRHRRRVHRGPRVDPARQPRRPRRAQRDHQGRCGLLEHRLRRDVASGRRVAVPLERPLHRGLVGAHAVHDAEGQRELRG